MDIGKIKENKWIRYGIILPLSLIAALITFCFVLVIEPIFLILTDLWSWIKRNDFSFVDDFKIYLSHLIILPIFVIEVSINS